MTSGDSSRGGLAPAPATVAVVVTRPETVLPDYARLLGLAGLAPAGEAGAWSLFLAAAAAAPTAPAAACPPWQLEGVVAALTAAGVAPRELGFRVPGHLRAATSPLRDWLRVMEAHGADASPEQPGGSAPDSRILLLAGLRIHRRLGLAAAVASYAALALDEEEREEAATARQALERAWRRDHHRLAGAVVDATVVGDGLDARGQVPVAAHLLLAGRDPVAVDAVACRLAGLEPRRAPQLATLARAGLGQVEAGQMELVGDLAAFPSGLGLLSPGRLRAAADLDAPGWWRRWTETVHERWPRPFARRRASRRYVQQPWGRLHEDYRRRGSLAGGEA